MFRTIYNTYKSEGFADKVQTNLTIPQLTLTSQQVAMETTQKRPQENGTTVPLPQQTDKETPRISPPIIPVPNYMTPNFNTLKGRDLCTPFPDGKLSRDCILQQITVAGCKPDGALYTALLNEATPTNYFNGARNLTSYKTYQQFSTNPLLDEAIHQGKITKDLALANLQDLANEAAKVNDTALNYAARDLCLKKGTMDTFNFCLDLANTTRTPFNIECLQHEFLTQGGNPKGSLYPTATTKFTVYDKLPNWGTVKEFISGLKRKTLVNDEAVKNDALEKFSGVTIQAPLLNQTGRINGLEVLWFNHGTNTFLGRRIPVTESQFPIVSNSQGTNSFDLIEYYAFTNIRPSNTVNVQMRLDSKNGVVTLKSSNGNTINNSDQCWALTKQGPNYVAGTWQDSGSVAHLLFLGSPCGTSNYNPLPKDWFTLVQEPKAPVFSWEGRTINTIERFTELRMPTVMDMIASPKTMVQTFTQPVFGSLKSVLRLKASGNGFANVRRNIAMNSWQTLSLGFIPISTTRVQGESAKPILKLGPLSVYTFGTDCVVRWDSATLNVEKSFLNVLTSEQEYYLVVNMRSDRNTQYPNRIAMAIGKKSDWSSGTVSIQNPTLQSASYTTKDGSSIYNLTDAAELILGDKAVMNTADVSIAFVRLFDYEIMDTDCRRDITNAWQTGFTG